MSDARDHEAERSTRAPSGSEADRTSARSGDTTRLDAAKGDEWDRAQDWRPRSNTNTARRGIPAAASVPRSPQELQLWLQNGGWKVLAAAAVFFLVILIGLLVISRNGVRERGIASPTATTSSDSGAGVSPAQPAVATLPPAESPSTTTPTARYYVVTGTDTEGLFLRADRTTDSTALETLPEGTQVEEIGPSFSGSDRVWRNVRAPSGKEGWAAADFLAPVIQ